MTQDLWSRGSRVVAERLRETAAAIPDQPFVQVGGGPWFPATISSLHGKRKRGSSGLESPYHHVRVVDDDDEVPVGKVREIVIRPREPT